MNTKRRVLLRGTLAAGAVGVGVGAGLLRPRAVLAAWPEAAFSAQSVADALQGLGLGAAPGESAEIKIKAPDIAENGAVVPITISTTLAGLQSIALLAEGNNQPLTSTYELGPSTEGYVAMRIKMGKTSNVMALVKADGKLYSAQKEVKVTIGGCGG